MFVPRVLRQEDRGKNRPLMVRVRAVLAVRLLLDRRFEKLQQNHGRPTGMQAYRLIDYACNAGTQARNEEVTRTIQAPLPSQQEMTDAQLYSGRIGSRNRHSPCLVMYHRR